MTSEADLSILSPTLPSIDTEESTGSKKKDINLWIYIRPPYEDEPKRYQRNEIMYCKYCIEKSHNSKSTSNFRQHLKSKHKIIVPVQLGFIRATTETQFRKVYIQLRTINQTIKVDSLALRNTLDKKTIITALISLITVRNLLFRIVE
jgi:hypothetical protein